MPSFRTNLATERIPTSIRDSIKQYIRLQSHISSTYVNAVVNAIDHHDPSLCNRLDLSTFTIVYLILSLSQDCLAQHRGMALLAVKSIIN